MKNPRVNLIHLSLGLLLFLVCVVALWAANPKPEPVVLVPALTGEEEYCLTCHADLPEISPSHPIEAFGCVICHGGERLALDEDLAHSSMFGGNNPSRLDVVERGCGGSDCHSGSAEEDRNHIQRVTTSVQATYTGAIATVRYSFGLQASLQAEQGVIAASDEEINSDTGVRQLTRFDPLADANPQITKFSENCLSCHLSAEPLAGKYYSRYTGCAACHTPTVGKEPDQPQHTLTTAIPYTQCNACHNRGNYSLRDMQFHPRQDSQLGRLASYYQTIAQFVQCEYTLDCVDCHTRDEVMGDGDIYSNQKEIQYTQCKTCHGTLEEPPLTYTITDPEDLALKMAALNPVLDLKVGDTILMTEKGEPLWNARLLPDGSFELFGKANGKRLVFNLVMGSGCQQDVEQQASQYCHECHAIDRE